MTNHMIQVLDRTVHRLYTVPANRGNKKGVIYFGFGISLTIHLLEQLDAVVILITILKDYPLRL